MCSYVASFCLCIVMASICGHIAMFLFSLLLTGRNMVEKLTKKKLREENEKCLEQNEMNYMKLSTNILRFLK